MHVPSTDGLPEAAGTAPVPPRVSVLPVALTVNPVQVVTGVPVKVAPVVSVRPPPGVTEAALLASLAKVMVSWLELVPLGTETGAKLGTAVMVARAASGATSAAAQMEERKNARLQQRLITSPPPICDSDILHCYIAPVGEGGEESKDRKIKAAQIVMKVFLFLSLLKC